MKSYFCWEYSEHGDGPAGARMGPDLVYLCSEVDAVIEELEQKVCDRIARLARVEHQSKATIAELRGEIEREHKDAVTGAAAHLSAVGKLSQRDATIAKLRTMIYAQWSWHMHPDNGEEAWQASTTKAQLDAL